jgi:hypothetical protein
VTIVLGLTPIAVDVALPRGGDFVAALLSETPWPAGIAIQLRFTTGSTAIVWPATIAGPRASWDVPAAQVATLLAAAPTAVRLHYVEPDGTVLVWGRGRVYVV